MRSPDRFISTSAYDADVVSFLNDTFYEAAERGAADIHFQETENGVRVRFRVQGRLRDYARLDGAQSRILNEKIRSRCDMSIADSHIPLDGRMKLRFDYRQVDIRVNIVPSVSGQTICCRLLDQTNACRALDEIEMTEMVRYTLRDVVEDPTGLVVVSGPTGSGKTTLLYAIINALNSADRNIITIENPVEYQVDGLTQINVDQHISFDGALRAVLRQDPDVILVGEIRDAETAKIAVQAAITGHLVLATIHANNSALAVTRLLDLGVDPQTLATALRAVTAQRLVARLPYDPDRPLVRPTEVEEAWLAHHGIASRFDFPVVEGEDDFKGVIPVIEMIMADSEVRKAIPHGAAAIFNAAARQPQFETLAAAGTHLAGAGLTSLDQVMRAVGSGDAVIPHTKRVGRILVDLGIIENHQLHEAMAFQTQLREQGYLRPLGEILVDKGLCTMSQVVAALGQSADAVHAARHFVRCGKLTETDLQGAIAEWQSSRQQDSLFSLLTEKGHVTEEELHDPAIIQS